MSPPEAPDYDLLPFPAGRRIIIDAGYLAASRHIVHGLVEVDVTRARELLKNTAGQDGRPLSFTAFIIASLARAVERHPAVHAYRDLHGRLVTFHDVDVAIPIEPKPGEVAAPHIVRAANRKTVREISEEIRSGQRAGQPPGRLGWMVDLAPRLPRFVRLLFIRSLKLNPRWVKQVEGTVIVTAVGMFGKHAGWGMAFLMSHTLGLTVGGIAQKPAAVDGAILIREFLDLTISFDHDILDGAPAARFTQSLMELIESASLLDEELPGKGLEIPHP
jgi:pyruvate/2-oxoglutarate dehydrogenase complex dihydrolipoamide acyltransferase (E2) component